MNNAGSLGHISFANELPSLANFRSEMDFNVTSSSWVSSRFAAIFGAKKPESTHEMSSSGKSGAAGADASDGGTAVAPAGDTARDMSNNLVVNVSSLAALQPFESWCSYSSGKAARDMFHRQVWSLRGEFRSSRGLLVFDATMAKLHCKRSYRKRCLELGVVQVRRLCRMLVVCPAVATYFFYGLMSNVIEGFDSTTMIHID